MVDLDCPLPLYPNRLLLSGIYMCEGRSENAFMDYTTDDVARWNFHFKLNRARGLAGEILSEHCPDWVFRVPRDIENEREREKRLMVEE